MYNVISVVIDSSCDRRCGFVFITRGDISNGFSSLSRQKRLPAIGQTRQKSGGDGRKKRGGVLGVQRRQIKTDF